MNLDTVKEIGRRYPIKMLRGDFAQEALLISMTCETKEEVRKAWSKASRQYGLFDPKSHVVVRPKQRPKAVPRRRRAVQGPLQRPDFWKEIHQHITDDERARLWRWAHSGNEEMPENVKEVLDVIRVHVLM